MSEITSPEAATVTALLQRGMSAHQAGDFQAALEAYRSVLEADPRNADALHLAGLLHAQHGSTEMAQQLIEAALELLPDEPLYNNNLGNLHVECGRAELALASFERAHAAAPERPDICNNLAVMLSRAGRADEAERLFNQVIAVAPGFDDARQNLANHLLRRGQVQQAVQTCIDGLLIAPRNRHLRRILGAAYISVDMQAEAEALYRAWLADEPDSAEANFKLAALTQSDVPQRAPDRFVTAIFDTFAHSFDAKLAQLGYRAPELVAEAVARHANAPAAALDVCDAGCGTGLCGPLLKPWARWLAGVDLSEGMLLKAQRRGVYDDLTVAELVAYLQARPAAFDLIVSADTLCYFGALHDFAAAAHAALRAGGLLVFTVEAHADEPVEPGFRLHGHGRYSHRPSYVAGALAAAGLELLEQQAVVLRMEAGQPVAGRLVTARRAAG